MKTKITIAIIALMVFATGAFLLWYVDAEPFYQHPLLKEAAK